MTGNNEPLGWIFYDAGCSWCARSAAGASPFLHRHGFALLPLQTPGVPNLVGVPPEALMTRMHLLTADGRRLAGADAFIEIARHVAWARPLAAVARLPMVLPLLRRGYDWIAAHRSCGNGTCGIRPRTKGHQEGDAGSTPQRPSSRKRRRVFFEMP